MKRILLADDELCSLMTLAEGLQAYSQDWVIFTAANGRQAADILEERSIDLIVTDLRMPVMNGYELLAYVREKKAGVPVVVMTADAGTEIERKLLPFGVSQYLVKPLHLSEITQAIERRLVTK